MPHNYRALQTMSLQVLHPLSPPIPVKYIIQTLSFLLSASPVPFPLTHSSHICSELLQCAAHYETVIS